MENKNEIQTDLAIIGTGMAGMAAAVFAANRGISAVVAGGAGAFEYSSGLLDLWGLTNHEQGYCNCCLSCCPSAARQALTSG